MHASVSVRCLALAAVLFVAAACGASSDGAAPAEEFAATPAVPVATATEPVPTATEPVATATALAAKATELTATTEPDPTAETAPPPTPEPAAEPSTSEPTPMPTAPVEADPVAAQAERFTPDPANPADPLISYWAISEVSGQPPSLRYAMASSSSLHEIYDWDNREFRVAIPFGAPPSESGILRVWSLDGGPATGGVAGPIYPVECLGPTPDSDGDALLDSCDPFPNDGPVADFDGDGVINREDNCPAIPNPDQAHNGRALDGEACSDDPLRNFDRILFSTTALDDVNARREAEGLAPVVYPVIDPVLRPAVAEFCRAAAALEPGTDFAVVVEMMPDDFGLSEHDRSILLSTVERATELAARFDALVASEGESAATAQALSELKAASDQAFPYIAPMVYSDQACQAP